MTPEELLNLSPGEVVRKAGFYYMRMADNLDFHIEGMFVDMSTGKLIHASHLTRSEDLYLNGQMAMSAYYRTDI